MIKILRYVLTHANNLTYGTSNLHDDSYLFKYTSKQDFRDIRHMEGLNNCDYSKKINFPKI